MNLRYLKIPFLFALIIMGACKEETIDLDKMPDPDRDYSLSVPLAQAYFTMGSFIEKLDDSDYLSFEDDGSIVHRFYETFELELEGMVALNNVNYSVNLPFANPTPESVAVNQTIIDKYIMNERLDARFDSVFLESGLLSVDNLNLPSGSTGNITIEIPELFTPSGEVFSYTTSVNNFSAENINLDDYVIRFSTGIDSSYITLNTNLDIEVPAYAVGAIGVDFGMNELIAEVTFGYFGNYAETIVDSMEFDAFDSNQFFDAIQMANVYVDVNTINSVGSSFNLQLDEVEFSKSGTDPKLLELGDNILGIEAASFGFPVSPSQQIFSYDKDNSNILDIIEDLPNKVKVQMTAVSNPENDESKVNFLHHYNHLQADLGITFPLHFRAIDYQRVDTLDLDFNDEFGDSDVTDAIENINLYLDVYNGLPFDIVVESITAQDANYNNIDYLIASPGEHIASAVPDEDGHVSESVHSEVQITLDKDQIDKFRDQNMKYIVITTQGASYGASDSDNTYIKIFKDNKLEMTLSAEIKGNIPND
nr:hypothetical protein [uncultured Carboxylicivirga sp.]